MTNAPDVIVNLVEKFKRNLTAYQSSDYKEAQLRQEFLNPFFEALGWDVSNRSGAAPQYRDVIFEDSIKIGGGTKAPDYCFTLSGQRMFFVEAKKPKVKIMDDKDSVYQLRRYAWSAKLPLAVLTNFEVFAIYESRKRPKNDEKSSTERVKYLTYEDYVEKWDEIANVFSKTAVLQGSFDKFLVLGEKKHGTQEVDDEFLNEIENWRESLARNIALRNLDISIQDLNYTVQLTIDRIIFLRMCEDRGIEPYGQLQSLIKQGDLYQNLCKIYMKCDDKYNSGLFHFKKEKGKSTIPDEITLKIKIDDSVLNAIIKNIYYPDSPYEFSVLPPEILGYIYEQFLGKIIRMTEGHRAKVEEKPEVIKAGGVYYTPKYIVDYIVENTVGQLCKKKTPEKISTIRILDPACGSGSFLLGAYTYLLKYHLNYYSNQKKPERLKDKIYQRKNGEWFLTIKEKKRILLNNIYGVDIDIQAVEVTKLSLLLKVLEGEKKDVFEQQQKLFLERALPDLVKNIKCGNSLVDSEYYDIMKQTEIPDTNSLLKLNIFDWKKEYEDIMNNGKFDIIIGNPPYMKIQTMQEFHPYIVEYLKKQYSSAKSGNYDIYIVFIERGMQLLKENGYLGFIVPHKFFDAGYGENLRKFISQNKFLKKIIHFSDYQIFNKASTYTCLLFLQNCENDSIEVIKFDSASFKPSFLNSIKFNIINSNEWSEKPWNIQSSESRPIIQKFTELPKLSDITTNIFQGPKSGADNVFIFKFISEKNNISTCFSKSINKEFQIETNIIHKYIKGKFIQNYFIDYSANEYTIFPYDKNGVLFSFTELKNNYPLAFEYFNMTQNKEILCAREKGRFVEQWWAYSRPQNMRIIFNLKILTPFNAFNNSFCLDKKQDFIFSAGVTGAYGILLRPEISISYEYLLGILNSQLVQFFIRNTSTCLQGGYYSYENKYIKNIPIYLIDENNTNEKDVYEKICEKVKLIMNLKEGLFKLKIPSEIELIKRQVDALEIQIDTLVYRLYGLTDEEINIVKKEL